MGLMNGMAMKLPHTLQNANGTSLSCGGGRIFNVGGRGSIEPPGWTLPPSPKKGPQAPKFQPGPTPRAPEVT